MSISNLLIFSYCVFVTILLSVRSSCPDFFINNWTKRYETKILRRWATFRLTIHLYFTGLPLFYSLHSRLKYPLHCCVLKYYNKSEYFMRDTINVRTEIPLLTIHFKKLHDSQLGTFNLKYDFKITYLYFTHLV